MNRIAIAQNSESEPEFKKQNLKELQTDECNIAHKAHTIAKIDDKDKTDPKLNKVLGQPMKALIIPEECDHIFSIPPRDLPGYPIETEWHCYCRRPNGPESRNLWTRVGKRCWYQTYYALTEKEEESDVISLPGGIEPPREEWFIEEISQPPSIVDTDLVFCHVILNKIEKEEAYVGDD
ncbi:hypothetical protein Bca52824_048466 [Brassica carinata]|uniref:NAC domain-containing protein n=1 Tax=Brassica carinata TaxID=52824 RepID=A0A8X7RJ10_BRACI|nr:hypothetical protein Bca52824_048466 [Brassica carinata]